ncbi:DUF934 domain-containing protein [bacterium]|nr:DUF934 domain-containing protein [bacterium]
MPQIIKNDAVIEDQWTLIDDEQPFAENAFVILPLDRWLNVIQSNNPYDKIGVHLAADTDMTTLSDDVLKSPLIAVHFPTFMDGRGFSIARILRDEKGYTGELRAVGYVIRDQLCYLKRCGFNAYALENTDLQAALESLSDFTESYQIAADTPQPLFRRRSAS